MALRLVLGFFNEEEAIHCEPPHTATRWSAGWWQSSASTTPGRATSASSSSACETFSSACGDRPRRVEPDLPDAADELAVRLRRGTLTADDLLQRYIEVVYSETKSLQETARLIGIDWRTVRAKLGEQREENG